MAAGSCPQCGAPRQPGTRFCGTCAFDFWKAAEASDTGTATPPSPEPNEPLPVAWHPDSRPPKSRLPIVLGIVGVVLVLGVIGSLTKPSATPSARSTSSAAAAAAGLEIEYPVDGATVLTSPVHVRGTAPAGTTVVLDVALGIDQHAQAGSSGQWVMPVELDEGVNELRFRLESDDGSERIVNVIFSPAATAAGTPAPTRTPAQTRTPVPAATPAPAFADINLGGFGDAVPLFTIPSDTAAIAQISHSGGGNFAVWTVDSGGSYNDLLVNEIGNYSGTVLFDETNGQHSVAFEITAGGSWTITVRPVTAARPWDGSSALNGHGDDVVRISPPISGLAIVTMQHTGSSNFAVFSYSSSGADLLVNEIGPYLGQVVVPSGTFLLEITADGAWTVAP